MPLPRPHFDHGEFFKSIEPNLPEGDIIEMGVFQGGSTRQLAKMGRRVWALDTFEGMPSEDWHEGEDSEFPGKFAPKLTVWEMFKDHSNICPLQGRFAETLPSIPKTTRIALAYLDCDLHDSYMQAFLWLEAHLVKDAVVLIDDYGACPGCRKAVDAWSEGKPIDWDVLKTPGNYNDRRYFFWREEYDGGLTQQMKLFEYISK